MAKKEQDDKVVERHVQSGEVTWDKERARDIRRPGSLEVDNPPQRVVAEEQREDKHRERKDDDEVVVDAGIDP